MPGTIDGVGLANEVAVALSGPAGDADDRLQRRRRRRRLRDLRILRKPFDTDALRSFIDDTMEAGARAH